MTDAFVEGRVAYHRDGERRRLGVRPPPVTASPLARCPGAGDRSGPRDPENAARGLDRRVLPAGL